MKRFFSLLSLATTVAMLTTGCGSAPDLTIKSSANAYDSETYSSDPDRIEMKAKRPSFFDRCMERMKSADADTTEIRCDNMMERISAQGGSR